MLSSIILATMLLTLPSRNDPSGHFGLTPHHGYLKNLLCEDVIKFHRIDRLLPEMNAGGVCSFSMDLHGADDMIVIFRFTRAITLS